MAHIANQETPANPGSAQKKRGNSRCPALALDSCLLHRLGHADGATVGKRFAQLSCDSDLHHGIQKAAVKVRKRSIDNCKAWYSDPLVWFWCFALRRDKSSLVARKVCSPRARKAIIGCLRG